LPHSPACITLRKRVNSFRYGTWYSTRKVAAVPPVMVT